MTLKWPLWGWTMCSSDDRAPPNLDIQLSIRRLNRNLLLMISPWIIWPQLHFWNKFFRRLENSIFEIGKTVWIPVMITFYIILGLILNWTETSTPMVVSGPLPVHFISKTYLAVPRNQKVFLIYLFNPSFSANFVFENFSKNIKIALETPIMTS